jgi:type II secretory pathway pseudopilin PulG
MTRRRGQSGLTLLEVVLALSLVAAVVGAAFAAYYQTGQIRDRLLARTEAVTARRDIMDKITADLQGALAYPFLAAGLPRTSEELQVITTHLPGAAAWAPPSDVPPYHPPETDLCIVGYRLARAEDPDGRDTAVGIERTLQRAVTARTTEEGPGKEVEVVQLTEKFRFLRFRYFGGASDQEAGRGEQGEQWLDNWAGGALPRAIEITLGIEPLPENTDPGDYPYETFQRTVYLPAAGGGAAK